MYFLDDHKNNSNSNIFWSFLLTGADYNRELKIWECANWHCFQTLTFTSSSASSLEDSSSVTKSQSGSQLPYFKTAIDLSSKYLVMSDITRKCFYVLHLNVEYDNTKASCSSISEFILAYPAVSFALIDMQVMKTKKYNQLNNLNGSSRVSFLCFFFKPI